MARPQVKAGSMILGTKGAVALVEAEIAVGMADGVAEQRFRPFQLAHQLFGVGVDEQLVGVEAMTVLRVVGPVHAIAIDLTGVGVGQVAVPDLVGVLGQFDALDLGFTAGIEQAQLHFGGVCGKDGEIHAQAVPGRPRGRAGPRESWKGS